jgi:hypothetical protein
MLLHYGTQIPKDFMQFVDASLDLPNFIFTFLDEGLLMGEFRGRQLRMEDLSLALFNSAVVLRPMSKVVKLSIGQSKSESQGYVLLFHGNLDTLYDRSLALRGYLLRTLERDEREL